MGVVLSRTHTAGACIPRCTSLSLRCHDQGCCATSTYAGALCNGAGCPWGVIVSGTLETAQGVSGCSVPQTVTPPAGPALLLDRDQDRR